VTTPLSLLVAIAAGVTALGIRGRPFSAFAAGAWRPRHRAWKIAKPSPDTTGANRGANASVTCSRSAGQAKTST
jgi:hypothetical protein